MFIDDLEELLKVLRKVRETTLANGLKCVESLPQDSMDESANAFVKKVLFTLEHEQMLVESIKTATMEQLKNLDELNDSALSLLQSQNERPQQRSVKFADLNQTCEDVTPSIRRPEARFATSLVTPLNPSTNEQKENVFDPLATPKVGLLKKVPPTPILTSLRNEMPTSPVLQSTMQNRFTVPGSALRNVRMPKSPQTAHKSPSRQHYVNTSLYIPKVLNFDDTMQ